MSVKHDPRSIDLLVVHHSASDPSTTTWHNIQAWHASRFKGIGYHRVIEADGAVMDGRRIQRKGAHSPPNANKLGVCVVGWNGNEDHPEWAWNRGQWESLVHELHYWCRRFPKALVCGHNQTRATLCPGLSLPGKLIEHGFTYRERLVIGQAA